MALQEPQFELGPEVHVPPQLDQRQRLVDIRESMGIVPAAQEEITEIIGVRSFPDRIGGAAKHLAEVVKHQTGANTNDKHRAARKIIRSWGDWAIDAEENADALSQLDTYLSDIDNKKLLLDRVISKDTAGAVEFLRHRHMEEFTKNGYIKNFGFNPLKIAYKTSNPGITPFVDMMLDKWNVLDVVKLLPADIAREKNRDALHRKSLGKVEKSFPYLRGVAGETLGKLAVITEVQ